MKRNVWFAVRWTADRISGIRGKSTARPGTHLHLQGEHHGPVGIAQTAAGPSGSYRARMGTSTVRIGTLKKEVRSRKAERFFTHSQRDVHSIHRFSPGSNHSYPGGDNPADLIEGPDGNLYGSTAAGGRPNGGVLFRIGKDGSDFKILDEFCSSANCADGAGPGMPGIGRRWQCL